MADSREFKTQSRKEWITGDGEKPSTEQLQLGALQRIADATEAMGKSWIELTNDRDYWKRRHEERGERVNKMERQIRGLKGAITRMKNKKQWH